MSKLWDDLKENMKEWSSSAVEKAEEMSRIAMAKTEEMTRISKIKFEIHQLQRAMGRKYEELGHLAYSHTKEDHMATFSGNTEFFNIVNRVDEIKVEVSDKETEIEKIKAEYGIEDSEIVDISKKNKPEPMIDDPKVNDDDLDAKQENDQNPRESIPE